MKGNEIYVDGGKVILDTQFFSFAGIDPTTIGFDVEGNTTASANLVGRISMQILQLRTRFIITK